MTDDRTGPETARQAMGQRLAANLLRNLDAQVVQMLAEATPRLEVPDTVTLADLEKAARIIDEHRLTVVCSPADGARLAEAAAGVPFPPRIRTLEGLDPGTAYAIAPQALRTPTGDDRRAELRRRARIDDR